MIHGRNVQSISNYKNKSLSAVRTIIADSTINDWNVGRDSQIRAERTDIASSTSVLKDESVFAKNNNVGMRIQFCARISCRGCGSADISYHTRNNLVNSVLIWLHVKALLEIGNVIISCRRLAKDALKLN